MSVIKLYSPAPGRRVTSPYGVRRHPVTGATRMHTGIDYGGVFNALAAESGIVDGVGSNLNPRSGFGHWVRIRHANNVYTFYAHGDAASKWKVGDRIKRGDVVFKTGTSGAATGPHLHFEVRTGKLQNTHKDPNIYFNAQESSVSVGIPVNGKLDKVTWAAWQQALRAHGYTGVVDGVPGRLTWSAIQRSVQPHGYKGPINGTPDRATYAGVQQLLKTGKFYNGPVDGVWGRFTISGLQTCLNQRAYK